MKIRLPLPALICVLVALPVLPVRADEPETELGEHMEKMSGPFRRLRRQASDASKNANSLAQIAIIREHLEAALTLEPVMKEDIPAAKQAKFVADYKKKMREMIELIGKVEAAIKANDNEKALMLVGDVSKAQKQNHKNFKRKDK